ncbi:MAG TPA: universal stress protein [Solirubrobacteraceae bacterium]
MLAELLDAQLLISGVHLVDQRGIGPGSLNAARFDAIEAAFDHALEGVDGVESETIAGGDVAATLVARAREVDACAIVVGTDLHAHVARDVLRHAPCPVVVTPGDALLVPEALVRVGVAYDGSVGSDLAASAARSIADRAGVGVEFISVDQHERVAGELRRAAGRLDLLCCGSHGRDGIAGRLLGSVSSKLVDQPPCPVMVVPVRSRRDASAPLGVTTAGDARLQRT